MSYDDNLRINLTATYATYYAMCNIRRWSIPVNGHNSNTQVSKTKNIEREQRHSTIDNNGYYSNTKDE